MPNPGTPHNVPTAVDCAVRKLAYDYGRHLLPERGSFGTLFEALQLQFCNLSTPATMDAYIAPHLATPDAATTFYVDANAALGARADGSQARPFPTLGAAVSAAANKQNATVLVRGGTYHLSAPLQITTAHSGLTIQNYEGEKVTVSGGVAFTLPRRAWSPFKQSLRWETTKNVNNVLAQVPVPGHDAEGIKYLGVQPSSEACAALATKSAGKYTAWTYHSSAFLGPFAKHCCAPFHFERATCCRCCLPLTVAPSNRGGADGRTDGAWAPVPAEHIDSGVLIKQNVWVADVAHLPALDEQRVPGLRINGKRAIRAKYPNGDPEQSGSFLKGASQGTRL